MEGSSCDSGVDQECYSAESSTCGENVTLPLHVESSTRRKRSDQVFEEADMRFYDVHTSCHPGDLLDDGVPAVGDGGMRGP